jgi:hypothetical protein
MKRRAVLLPVTLRSSVSVAANSDPSTVEVPDLAGKSRSEVRNILRAAGLELGTIDDTQNDDVPEGKVAQQYPEAGSEAERGTPVRITLSSVPQNLRGPDREGVPPVPQEEFNISHPIGSFARVVWRIVTKPTEFFSTIPRRGNMLAPLVFAMICLEISTILGEGVRLRLTDTGIEYPDGFLTLLAVLILVPVLTPIVLFLIAGALHLLVMLIAGSRNSGFGGTFRVIAYAYVTSLVYWLPLIGWVLSLYSIYLAIVGIREVHNTSTGKATVMVLTPAVLWFLVLLMFVLLFATAVSS